MRSFLFLCSLSLVPLSSYASVDLADDVNLDNERGTAAKLRFCSTYSKAQPQRRTFDENVSENRARAIIMLDSKWSEGSTLSYYFMGGSESEKQTARDGFEAWKATGLGLNFRETDNREESDIRISFDSRDGAWSYVGTYIKQIPKNEATMNLGWQELDTAIHEIGHTLGLPHEHQNPKAGITWNEDYVIAELAKAPNYWDESTTRFNIINKLDPREVDGSTWDKDSIMHYPFGPGFIEEPEELQNGVYPEPGLSEKDIEVITTFYPPITGNEEFLQIGENNVNIQPGGSVVFKLEVPKTSEYVITTRGAYDTLMTLFDPFGREIKTDDDSGKDLNARINEVIFTGHQYTLSTRLYWKDEEGSFKIFLQEIPFERS